MRTLLEGASYAAIGLGTVLALLGLAMLVGRRLRRMGGRS